VECDPEPTRGLTDTLPTLTAPMWLAKVTIIS
jgi:hypothetical protein